jgi:hypothetical protein
MNNVSQTPQIPPGPGRHRWPQIVCGAIWLGMVIAGLAFLWIYENTPAKAAVVPAAWPAGSGISRTAGLPTLVMFAHPQCPCTEASMRELESLLAQCQAPVRVHVVFYKPAGSPDAWARTGLWKSAVVLPGVDVRCDEAGAEAREFGATNSGFVVLYDGQGRLCYSGGITAERGHSGDNEGRRAIVAIVNGGEPHLRAMPVFGCSLSDPESKCQKAVALWKQ